MFIAGIEVHLTHRESSVVKLICQGKSNDEIAKELSCEKVTIKHYMNHIFKKMNVHNRVQLAVVVTAPLDSPLRKIIEERNLYHG